MPETGFIEHSQGAFQKALEARKKMLSKGRGVL
jgi:hypothetical protein